MSKLFLGILFILFSSCGYGQYSELIYHDSLKEVLTVTKDAEKRIELMLELCDFEMSRDWDKAEDYRKKIEFELERFKGDSRKLRADSYLVFKYFYAKDNNPEMIFKLLFAANKTYKDIGDSLSWAGAQIELGGNYDYFVKDYKIALKCAGNALRIYTFYNDSLGIAKAHNLIGIQNVHLEDHDSAVDDYTKALVFLTEADKLAVFSCYANRSSSYGELGEYSKARNDLDSALAIKVFEFKNNKTIEVYARRALLHLELGEFLKARKDVDVVERRMEDITNVVSAANVYWLLGEYYRVLNDVSKAHDMFCLAYESVKNITGFQRLGELLDDMTDVAVKKGETNLAIQYAVEASRVKDSLHKKMNLDQVAQWQAIHKVNEKIKEIDHLKIENDLKDERLTTGKQRFGLLLGSIFFISGIAFFLFWEKKRILKSSELIWRKNKELEHSSILLEKMNVTLEEEVKVLKKEDQSTEGLEKYRESNLSDDEMDRLQSILNYFVTKEKVYLDPELTLGRLSELLEINRAYMSRVINTRFNQNFNQFINTYRVREACKLLSDKNNDAFTIEYIAQSAGFRSISSFNTVFKKDTGFTPSYYRKRSTKSEKG